MKAKTVFLTALTVAALGAGSWAQSAGPVTVASNDAKAAPAVAGSGGGGAAAGSGAAAAAAAAPAAPPSIITAADVQALKDALAAQQLEIERLSQQLDRQQAQQSAGQAAE